MKKISLISAILLLSFTASARNLRIQSFGTTHNTTYIMTEDALLKDQPFKGQSPGRIYFYGDYSLQRDPWIDLDDSGENFLSTLIAQSQVLNLGIGYLASENLQWGFELPLEIVKTENYPAVNSALDGSSVTGLGDSRLFAKWKFYESTGFAMALQPTLYMPTGMRTVNGYSATATSSVKTGIGTSWGSFGAGLKLNLEKQFEKFMLAANAGLEYHPNSLIEGQRSVFAGTTEYSKVDFSTLYVIQLAAFIPLAENWGLNLETGGKFSGKHNEYTQPGESYAGIRYQLTADTSIHAGYGGGAGFKNGIGERYLVGIKTPFFMPGSKAVAVTPPPPPKPKKVVYTAQKLEISQSIEFESGKDTLTPYGKEILDEVAQVLLEKQDSIASVIAEGHTDYQGTLLSNQDLSERRAMTAKRYLISKGVNAKILSSRGFGETKPIFPGENITAEQMHKNRRVEFLIKEKGF